ncbi:MAG: sigma-70 family RNA polymerase sigma factor [Oscillospiraceae bacterium]|nr:sigma-70 family RNA polymerase sigma factor [Oscillospiraceae bacterium]
MDSVDYARAVDACGEMVFRLAFSYTACRADAEDCCQEVFLKLYRVKTDFADDEHIRAWLITATRRQCIDLFRSFWKKRVTVTGELAAVRDEESRGVLESVMRLPKNQRDVVYLHYYEGYAVKELARMLGAGESAVKQRLNRGRQALKALLEQEDRI